MGQKFSYALETRLGSDDQTLAFKTAPRRLEIPKGALQSERSTLNSCRARRLESTTVAFLTITSSQARRAFKNLLGNTNHELITILVGLNGVEKGRVEKDAEFATSWNPRDVRTSARESGAFARGAALAWCVDSLDAYLRLIGRKPFLVQDATLRNALDDAGQSVLKRFDVIRAQVEITEAIACSLVELAIAWRNRLIHYMAENEIAATSRAHLNECARDVSNDYRGLVVHELLESFDRKQRPRFKEIASMIAATHRFVRAADIKLLTMLDLEAYIDESLAIHVKRLDRRDTRTRIDAIWSKDRDRRRRSLAQIFQNYSIATMNTRPETPSLDGDILLDRYADMTYQDAVQKFDAVPT
jgi:hypothetical protein